MDDEQLGRVSGQLDIVKELLSDHIKQSREERVVMQGELEEIKRELTSYKFFLKAVAGTILCVATFKLGDISSLWH